MSPDRSTRIDANRRTTSRRSVLRSVGAGAVASLALGTGSAGAAETLPDLGSVAAGYRSPGAAREAVATHGRGVVAELADRGVLDRADLDQFGFADAEATALLTPDGVTGQVAVSRETADHRVTVVVRPAAGEAYATAEPTGDAAPLTVHDEGDGFSITDGYLDYGCGGAHCYDLLCSYREQLQYVDGSTEVIREDDCCVCE